MRCVDLWRTIRFLHNEPIMPDSVAVRSYSCRQEFNCVLQLYIVESFMFWYMLALSFIYFVSRIRPWKFFTRCTVVDIFGIVAGVIGVKGRWCVGTPRVLRANVNIMKDIRRNFWFNISTDFSVVIFSRVFQYYININIKTDEWNVSIPFVPFSKVRTAIGNT